MIKEKCPKCSEDIDTIINEQCEECNEKIPPLESSKENIEDEITLDDDSMKNCSITERFETVNENEEEVVTEKPMSPIAKSKLWGGFKNKKVLASCLMLLLILIMVPATYSLSANYRAYNNALQMLHDGEFMQAKEIFAELGSVAGVVTARGHRIGAKTVILTAGTFMEGKIFIGEYDAREGRLGEEAAIGLGKFLRNCGFPAGRLKTTALSTRLPRRIRRTDRIRRTNRMRRKNRARLRRFKAWMRKTIPG